MHFQKSHTRTQREKKREKERADEEARVRFRLALPRVPRPTRAVVFRGGDGSGDDGGATKRSG